MGLPPSPDISGQIYGQWSVVSRVNGSTDKYHCVCSCGTKRIVSGYSMRIKNTTSCGCSRFNKIVNDLTDKRFGRLVALLPEPKDPKLGKQHTMWVCECDCGSQVVVNGSSLTNNTTRSCGCLRIEATRARKTKHGQAKKGNNTKEYQTWAGMIRRCYNSAEENYDRYGGRGIKVCDAWRESFETFFKDVGPCPGPEYSIDRFPDNNGNYEPGNVRWATTKQQSRNTRRNRLITHDGHTRTVVEWSEITGIQRQTIIARIEAGWSPEKALTTSVRNK
jgi:hypothetical protein